MLVYLNIFFSERTVLKGQNRDSLQMKNYAEHMCGLQSLWLKCTSSFKNRRQKSDYPNEESGPKLIIIRSMLNIDVCTNYLLLILSFILLTTLSSSETIHYFMLCYTVFVNLRYVPQLFTHCKTTCYIAVVTGSFEGNMLDGFTPFSNGEFHFELPKNQHSI